MNLPIVDARGLACPQPIIELAKAIARLSPGAELELLATDDAVERDLTAWSQSTGHALTEVTRANGVCRARVRKNGQSRVA